ncbi:MAG: hypothetical protein IJO74_03740 [Clostridia bacterium]|nr:hypothetical protein [Clostridia bacterium]
MSYSAKTGDINVFAKAIIDVGTKRRAQEAAERKSQVNSDKYAMPKPRVINGGMNTNDNLKAVTVKSIEETFSDVPAEVKKRSRPVPQAPVSARKMPISRESGADIRKTKSSTLVFDNQKESAVNLAATQRTDVSPNLSAGHNVRRSEQNDRQNNTNRSSNQRYERKIYIDTVKTERDKNRKPFPLGMLSSIIVVAIFLIYFIVLCIQSFELKSDISELKSNISESESLLSTWEAKLDEKNPSLDKIEEFAVQDGMIRKTPDKYISVTPPDDVIERYDSDK